MCRGVGAVLGLKNLPNRRFGCFKGGAGQAPGGAGHPLVATNSPQLFRRRVGVLAGDSARRGGRGGSAAKALGSSGGRPPAVGNRVKYPAWWRGSGRWGRIQARQVPPAVPATCGGVGRRFGPARGAGGQCGGSLRVLRWTTSCWEIALESSRRRQEPRPATLRVLPAASGSIAVGPGNYVRAGNPQGGPRGSVAGASWSSDLPAPPCRTASRRRRRRKRPSRGPPTPRRLPRAP